MILLTDDQIDLIAERIAAKLRLAEKKTYTLKEAAEFIDNYYDPHGWKRALAPTQKGGAA